MGLLFTLLNPLNFDEMCIVTNLKYIITVCYDVIILYNFLPMHSFFFPLVYIKIITLLHVFEELCLYISFYSRWFEVFFGIIEYIDTVLFVCLFFLLERALYNKVLQKSGPSCSELTMSLVNDSLKFTSSDTQICFALQKLLTFFSAKIIRKLCIESAKTVNEMTLNEPVKLTTF